MINILILSAGTRDKVVQYFKEALAGKGKVIATDCSPYAPAIYEADEYVLVPRITEPGYLDKILEICREKQITGALLAGATLVVKRIRGLRRAALAPTIPTAKGKAVLIDCGANAECTVEYLLQFAYLGSYYAQKVLGVENPRIGLLNIGAEESKGDTLRRETYQKLKEAGEAGHLNFTGNIEAKEAMLGECDVIVADGYSGNIMLKSIEGTGKLLSIKLKEMLMHSTGTKLAALLLKGQLGDFKKMLDANEVGGTALLGISKPVVKAHGSASEVGICNAVRQAMEVARSGIIDDIAQNIDKMRIEQKAE